MMASQSRRSSGKDGRKAEAKVVSLPSPQSDDASLVGALQEGTPAAFALLYDRFAGLVRGLLLRVMGHEEGVDDLTQDVFLIVVRRCADIRRPESLRAFVHGVAVRCAKDELRRRRLRRWIGWSDTPEGALPCRSQDPDRREAVSHVYAALEKLGVDLRLAFTLRHIEGMELAEAAAACSWSLSTFKRRLYRAERRFNALVDGDPVLLAVMAERKGRS